MKSESDHQKQVVLWCRGKGLTVFCVRNEGRMSHSQRAFWASMGLLAGIPDLIFLDLAKDGRPVALEMKKNKYNRPTERQLKRHEQMVAKGWTVIVGYGAKDAIQKLKRVFGL